MEWVCHEACAPSEAASRRPGGGAVFLDRDGVINENRGDHVKCWAEFSFVPGALEAIAALTRDGFRLFVVTNQAVVGRGVTAPSMVQEVHERMVRAIERHGGRIEAVAYCPHRPEDACGCRKPQPGLLLGLAERYGLDLAESVVVGDALSDLDAARDAGCRGVLVLTGRGRAQLEQARREGRRDLEVAADLGAVALLLRAAERVAA
jgi:D-glycero-D-manno-heptose 1,7-bisphosphate phosphatase